ncbi:hypothetical protein [Heyndrickxia coagulans]|nr:hypothetical protein [Heyndrickxia coagulans]
MTHLQFNLNLDVLKEAIMTSDLDAVINKNLLHQNFNLFFKFHKTFCIL